MVSTTMRESGMGAVEWVQVPREVQHGKRQEEEHTSHILIYTMIINK